MSDKQQQQVESTKQEVKSPGGDENVKKFPRSETEASLRRAGVLSDEALTKMRKDLRNSKETVIKVTNKERVNMKLSVACELLWCIKVDDKYDINLSTSWKGENGEKEPSLEKAYGKVQRKTDRVSIPGPGTFSLMLDNSYSWLNTKVVKLSFVTGSATMSLTSVSEPAPEAPPRKLSGGSAIAMAVETWTPEAVCKWLKGADLGQYESTFASENIDGKCLIRLAEFSPRHQAEFVSKTLNLSVSSSLHFGLELRKLLGA